MSNFYPRFKRFVAVFFLTGLTLFGVGLGTAQAGKDWKTYPGLYCRPADMDSPHVGYVARSGSIYNQSTSSGLLIYCPIVRDMMKGKAKWTQVLIRYRNSNPNSKIRCDMQTRSPDGRLMKSRKAYSSQKVGLMRIYNNSKSGIGVYMLSCSLPPRRSPGVPEIFFIQVREAD